MNALTTFSYAGSKITFATESGVRVNATQMAKPFGKSAKDWLKTQTAKEFIVTFSEVKKILSADLVTVVYGDNGGTWMHEDVALEFARWLSPKFAIWCNDRIKELFMTNRQAAEAEVLPSPVENRQAAPSLVEYVDGKAVTTSRILARVLGRKHDSVLGTIKDNLGNRAFKYDKFIRRPYSCGSAHGYEFLITRPGFDVLVSLMRNGAKPKLREAYKYAWGKAPAALPSPAEPVETVEAEVSKQKCLPGFSDTEDVLAVPDEILAPAECLEDETSAPEVDSEYIDWLEKYNDELGTDLSKARETMRLYSELYTEAREQRQRVLDELGRASDLYGDLVMRLSALQSEEVDRCLNAHREFRARLTGKVNLS